MSLVTEKVGILGIPQPVHRLPAIHPNSSARFEFFRFKGQNDVMSFCWKSLSL